MSENKFLKIVILLLILVNAMQLGFIWLRKPPFPPPGQGKNAAIYLTKELQFTPEQEKKYETLHRQHHRQMDSIRKEDVQIRERLFDLLQLPAVDSATVGLLADSLGINKANSEKITFGHFVEVKQLCTPPQQQKFNEIINKALQMLQPPKPPKQN